MSGSNRYLRDLETSSYSADKDARRLKKLFVPESISTLVDDIYNSLIIEGIKGMQV